MATIHLYDKLLQFSLFQGMSPDELMQVVAHTKFNFIKIESGKKIVKEGEKCNSFNFIINGSFRSETAADNRNYTIVEHASAPFLIQHERLFGLSQHYQSTLIAESKVNILSIDKKEVMQLVENFIVFRLNMLNLFTSTVHKQHKASWQHSPTDLRKRIIKFIANHVQHPVGQKTIYVLMENLAKELNDSRLDISKALNSLQEEGMLTLGRGRIEIPAFENLIKWEPQ